LSRDKRANGAGSGAGANGGRKGSKGSVPSAEPGPEVVTESSGTLPQSPLSTPSGFTVVGIGASAGGAEALSRLLPRVPEEGFAYVIVPHLPLDHGERFTTEVVEHTSLPVVTIESGTAIQPGNVYLAPAQTLVGLADGRFFTARRADPPIPPLPVDHFLHSLAASEHGPGIAVLLSGVSSDGIAGLREIKAAGGYTLVQDPATARYDSLPQAAIQGGLADLVLPPERMAGEFPLLVERDDSPVQAPASRRALDDDELLAGIFDRLKAHSGVDFSSYKPGTVRRRLHRRMVLNRIDDPHLYARLLDENVVEVKELFQDLLIHVTHFFRDPASFDAVQEHVFARLLAERRVDDPLRFWVPGCSTGEEAYSLAMSLLEFLGERAATYPIQIFATDLSESAVAIARAGLYPLTIAEQVAPERLARFFVATESGYRIAKPVRDLCIFTKHDLTRDPPFSHLDLVMCRNVLIYLGPTLQKRVISVLHYSLESGGFLVLGSAESIGARGDLFRAVDKRHSIYSKKGSGVATLPGDHHGVGMLAAAGNRVAGIPAAGRAEVEADRLLLERYAPPGVLVDSGYNIVQTRGQTGNFLELAPGEASLNVLRMAREGLLYGLRTALQHARHSDQPVRKDGLQVRRRGEVHTVDVEVVPIGGPAESRHYLIVFEERQAAASRPAPPQGGVPELAAGTLVAHPLAEDDHVRELQEELAGTRNYLQAMVQDLEAANEELQSANEEILSSNEELQSTNEELDTAKEELQSTNEELHTLNEELQGRNDDLARANADLTNLLGSIQLAVVMVDASLRIRRFTPAAERVLNLIATDVGRPIGHIKPNIECPDLEKLIARVIENVETFEGQVQGVGGNTYLLRIRSYKDLENRIDGAVLSLLDVGEVKAQTDAAVRSRRVAEGALRAWPQPIAVLRANGIEAANRQFLGLFGLAAAEAYSGTLEALASGREDLAQLRRLVEERAEQRGEARFEHVFPGVGRRAVLLRRVDEAAGEPPLVLVEVRESGDGA
jgi:two-component system CheB/CheR fusion protein